jgi:hypothetical protein
MVMDLSKTIADLYEEKAKLDRVIASLEQLGENASSFPMNLSRRGRKFMSPEERHEVSERMRKYWALRKGERTLEAHAFTPASAA